MPHHDLAWSTTNIFLLQISPTSKMSFNDLTLTDAVKHIQQSIQQTLPNLHVDVNNLFEIICEVRFTSTSPSYNPFSTAS